MSFTNRGRAGVAGVAALVAISTGGLGCGSGSHNAPATESRATWQRQHGPAVAAVGTELNLARTALAAGDRQAILGACALLRDDVTEARKGLPVPNPTVDPALRQGLVSVDTGAADCLQGARVASNAGLNEKAMAELADARTAMDAAQRALAAWQ